MNDPRQQQLPGAAPTTRTETDALADQIRRATEPSVMEVHRGTPDVAGVLLVPQGMAVHHIKPFLDAYLPLPVRRAGTTVLHDLASFIAAVKRAKSEATVVYLDANAVRAVAVFDHDLPGPDGDATARWGGHRAEMLRLSSFPADYPLQGTRRERTMLVGNAVPPRLAQHVVRSTMEALS